MNRPSFKRLLMTVGLSVLGVFFHVLPAAAQRLTVIAHPATPVTSISRSKLADIFMKRDREWSDGSTIRPVHMLEGSEQREQFLSNVLRRTERSMTKYWIGQKLYTGDHAPIKLGSEEAVIRFVATVRGAIGYVMYASPEELDSVKILTVSE